MKKRTIILLVLSVAVAALAAILFPQRREGSTVVDLQYGDLTLAGKAVVVPFIGEMRIGVWEAEYDNGQVGAHVEYSWGRASDSYREYYPNGSLRTASRYRNGALYGAVVTFREDGSVQYFASRAGDDKAPPTEEIFYDADGKVIVYARDGESIVDNTEEHRRNQQNKAAAD